MKKSAERNNAKKLLAVLLSVFLTAGLTACGAKTQQAQPAAQTQDAQSQPAQADVQTQDAAQETKDTQDATPEADADQAAIDQAAADHVAELIDAIYVQTRDEYTDALCAEAKAAWDALTDAQKELVEGEEADPDYFGRDTGDGSADDTRNSDEIGENELLVVSFGTSFNDSRTLDIKGIEDALEAAFPGWAVRRAFTAQIIINHVQAREGYMIDNMEQALGRAVQNGVKNLVIQPTHLMHGAEYDELMETLDAYRDKFEKVAVAEPLLGEVGSDATVINEDKEAVAKALVADALSPEGFESMEAAAADGTAFVFMGHGTSHTAKVSYSQMQTQMSELGYTNAFIGTVEGEPEETSCENVIEAVKAAGYTKVVLRPMMVVAGDHAYNDMAGEEADSWLNKFKASGSFESVKTQIAGLGRIADVQALYAAHTKAAIESAGLQVEPEVTKSASADAAKKNSEALEDGYYSVKFDTDSSMFKVNETCDGKGTLKVENGEMTIHVTLLSQKILNLFPGTAEQAATEGAELLMPTEDAVTYKDGITETVYGFDIPVPAIGEEFDCALVGTKGTWYDHKVTVSDPEKLFPLVEGPVTAEVTLKGGSGKASVASPAKIVFDGKKAIATIVWSSPYYEYMIVNDVRYEPVQTEGNSTFEIPVILDAEYPVSACTTAMSEPHLIDYTLCFDSATIKGE